MDVEDKKDIGRIVLYSVIFTALVIARFLEPMEVDPFTCGLILLGATIGYRLLKKIIVRHAGLTPEDIEDIEDDFNINNTTGKRFDYWATTTGDIVSDPSKNTNGTS